MQQYATIKYCRSWKEIWRGNGGGTQSNNMQQSAGETGRDLVNLENQSAPRQRSEAGGRTYVRRSNAVSPVRTYARANAAKLAYMPVGTPASRRPAMSHARTR
jgi:hypothetical protein